MYRHGSVSQPGPKRSARAQALLKWRLNPTFSPTNKKLQLHSIYIPLLAMPPSRRTLKCDKVSSLPRLITIAYAKPGGPLLSLSKDFTKGLSEDIPAKDPAKGSANPSTNTQYQAPKTTPDLNPTVKLAAIPDFQTEYEFGLYLLQHKRKSALAQAQIARQYSQWIKWPMGMRSNLSRYNGRKVQYLMDEVMILAINAAVGREAPGKCCRMHKDLLEIPREGVVGIKGCRCVFCTD